MGQWRAKTMGSGSVSGIVVYLSLPHPVLDAVKLRKNKLLLKFEVGS